MRAVPREKEVLTSRLIDRPIRPLFHESFRNETLVVITMLAHDMENDPDIVAMVATSAALTHLRRALHGPDRRGPRRLSRRQVRASTRRSSRSRRATLDLVVAGTTEGVLMVESEAKELPEDVMLAAVMEGHRSFQPVIEAIIQLAEHAAKEPLPLAEPPEAAKTVAEKLKAAMRGKMAEAYAETVKQPRQQKVGAVKDEAQEAVRGQGRRDWPCSASSSSNLEAEVVRDAILDTGKRIDGRDTKTVRPIVAEVGILPRAHGSALFTRGETQALVVATLGTGQDEQIIDALEGEYREHFMMHYNMPPYSVGEVRRMGSPGRREIGHGKLAWRALRPMLPGKDKFPYTIRVVSEITESNGSSSMASVCGGSLALMDAGVPMERPVAGIAMGLIKEGERFAVLSDILGDEDHLGDMDFKVAGTEQRHHRAADGHQDHLDHRGDHEGGAGPGQGRPPAHPGRDGQGPGRGARERQPERAAHHPVHDPEGQDPRSDRHRRQGDPRDHRDHRHQDRHRGRRHHQGRRGRRQAGPGRDRLDQGHRRRAGIGVIYTGKVVKTVEFGAFVNFLGARDGLVHISELAPRRVAKVNDVVKEGDQVKVKVLGVDDRGKVRLVDEGGRPADRRGHLEQAARTGRRAGRRVSLQSSGNGNGGQGRRFSFGGLSAPHDV